MLLSGKYFERVMAWRIKNRGLRVVRRTHSWPDVTGHLYLKALAAHKAAVMI